MSALKDIRLLHDCFDAIARFDIAHKSTKVFDSPTPAHIDEDLFLLAIQLCQSAACPPAPPNLLEALQLVDVEFTS
jgi:hypothetical protein